MPTASAFSSPNKTQTCSAKTAAEIAFRRFQSDAEKRSGYTVHEVTPERPLVMYAKFKDVFPDADHGDRADMLVMIPTRIDMDEVDARRERDFDEMSDVPSLVDEDEPPGLCSSDDEDGPPGLISDHEEVQLEWEEVHPDQAN